MKICETGKFTTSRRVITKSTRSFIKRSKRHYLLVITSKKEKRAKLSRGVTVAKFTMSGPARPSGFLEGNNFLRSYARVMILSAFDGHIQ